MKTAVLERVKQIIDHKANSVNDFAGKIGMYQNTVNNQVTGVRGISLDLIMAILKTYPDISSEWLLRGNGAMIVNEHTSSTYNIKGTDNSVNIGGDSQGDITTNCGSDKEIISKLLEQNQQLINILAKR